MDLENLFADIPVAGRVHWNPNKRIVKITSDSRQINRGDVFVACRGARMDGHDFLNEAVYAGASVIVFEELHDVHLPADVTAIQVENSQACLSRLLNRYHGFPDQSLKLIATTGTNGKTTVSFLLNELLKQKASSAYLGTLWYDFDGGKRPALNTTPGAEILVPMLAEMVEKQNDYCALEVSSHALDQNRVHGLQLELSIFTQLT